MLSTKANKLLSIFNDTATYEIYTLSIHDALPIFMAIRMEDRFPIVDIMNQTPSIPPGCQWAIFLRNHDRSEEHTSELQSQSNLVCRLLLEKKKVTLYESSRSDISYAALVNTHSST